jgi:predicted DNA-binding transcriptional regulator AlpA
MAKKRKSASARKAPPAVKAHDQRERAAPVAGDAVVWPAGVEKRYGISSVTRWRWERTGTLPQRDIHVGGRSGWRPETLQIFEQRSTTNSPQA